MDTISEYNRVIAQCQDLFIKKTKDYGTAWRIMRLTSITDQLYIKAQRIRTLEVKKVSKVGEGVIDEYIGIINYCVIAMMQLELGEDGEDNLDPAYVEAKYTEKVNLTRDLMLAKNHDYGEAWRDMRVSSLTDMILTKLHRVKQIEDNNGETLVSEGLNANYQDMLNYAVFALIKLGLAEKAE
ncbi:MULTISPECIES: DUF1599 domain-containing protein [Sphingobacterium]|uniref:DUF1599 domain-containing protein n=1 Tax=Sphingobacterium hotanense TaxID=649196 RepID=A0ABT7NR38_9SPHI|nr:MULTISPECIES: DUF1599 domain-containing protein [Sphingobacterium]MCT1525587.1 DUF1599 domain-containing protein [Sphingobacterium hotanense]MDM1049719.1 DUF1599 domain-containing protein [Sphingobacterium hotanense]